MKEIEEINKTVAQLLTKKITLDLKEQNRDLIKEDQSNSEMMQILEELNETLELQIFEIKQEVLLNFYKVALDSLSEDIDIKITDDLVIELCKILKQEIFTVEFICLDGNYKGFYNYFNEVDYAIDDKKIILYPSNKVVLKFWDQTNKIWNCEIKKGTRWLNI